MRIWLLHLLDNNTPQYGGLHDFKIVHGRSIAKGDTCNTSELKLPCHTGTHVDAPLHFIKNARNVVDYSPDQWIFKHINVLFFTAEPGQIIEPDHIDLEQNEDTDAILFKTSFEMFREEELYWKENPGLSPDLADYIVEKCPNIQIIGMDFISISSFLHRTVGRAAHKCFLEKNIRLIEDMRLKDIETHDHLFEMIVLPVRFFEAEGSPCTIIGDLEK